jgi:hypothetical protein
MSALEAFNTTMTLCFTPEHLATWPHYTAPPKNVEDFAEFVTWAVTRYASHGMARGEFRAEQIKVGAKE